MGYRKDLFATCKVPHQVHVQVYGGPNTRISTKCFAEQERFLSGNISTLGIKVFQYHCWFYYPLMCDLEQVTYYCLSEGSSSLIGYIKYPTCLTLGMEPKWADVSSNALVTVKRCSNVQFYDQFPRVMRSYWRLYVHVFLKEVNYCEGNFSY